ncbi:hypothetical protein GCM10027578_26920 [Spirosoma luteolum]
MNNAFPDATVMHHEGLIDSLILPDPDDRHVLAAAIRCQADVLVTANLKDFPESILSPFDLVIQHPDQFIAELIDADPSQALLAFEQQVSYLKNPPLTREQVLATFSKVGLSETADRFRRLL